MKITAKRLQRIGTFILLIFLASILFLGCSTKSKSPASSGTKQPFKIGLISSLTVKGADWGKSQNVAARMAAEDITKNGGINGYPVEIITFDDAGDPQQTVMGVRRLAEQDKVIAILGPLWSTNIETGFPLANQLQVPIITNSSSLYGIARKYKPWAFHNNIGDEQQLEVAMPKFAKKYNVKTAVVTGDVKDVGSKAVRGFVLDSFKKSGVTVLNESDPADYVTGQTDYSAVVTKLKSVKADAMGYSSGYLEGGMLAKEMKRQGWNVPVVTASGLNMALISSGGDAVEGWVGTGTFWDGNPDPKTQEFVSNFKVKAQEAKLAQLVPIPYDSNTYDSTQVIAHILNKAKLTPNDDLKKIRETLREGHAGLKDYPSLSGRMSYDDHEVVKDVYAFQLKGGKILLLE